MDENGKQLLEKFGVIAAPFALDHEGYLEIAWCLAVGRELYPNKSLELRCAGNGGELSSAFALADLIRADGNVDGIALGQVASAHTVLFAACARRFVHPNALLLFHQANRGNWMDGMAQGDYWLAHHRIAWVNNRMAAMFAEASNKPSGFWLDTIHNTSDEMVCMDANMLIGLAMAQPITERYSSEIREK